MAKSNRITRRNMKKSLQVIYSEKRKIFVEKYLSPKGKKLLLLNQITKEEAWKKYGKNRYRINPNAVPIKEIRHTSR